MLMDASDLAFEICGCANREQRKRDIALIEKDREQARMEERAAVVAWLRRLAVMAFKTQNPSQLADKIEAGRHLK